MSWITELARGQQCQIRLEGICNFNCETTVAAHFRLIGVTGLGYKDPDLDLLAAWSCSNCHDAIDRRRFLHLDYDKVRLAHAEGLVRTQAKILRLVDLSRRLP